MDGAYYAIKGYSFQFDKTLIELLTETDGQKLIGIEQIQDINDDTYVTQVKFKETQDYSETKIREAVLQLFEEYKKDPTKEYRLYCYFKDKIAQEFKPSKEELELILATVQGVSVKTKKLNARLALITKKEKDDFLKKFTIVFAPTFQQQFEQVLEKLNIEYPSTSDEEQILYYSQMVHLLVSIIINKPNQKDRKCTKDELLKHIANTKKLVFTSAFKEYRGAKEYFNLIESKFETPRKNRYNFIFIGDIEIDSSVSIAEVVVRLVESYFVGATSDIKPPVLIIDSRYIKEVKRYLIEREILFNDGYEDLHFSAGIFSSEPIINKLVKGKKSSDSLAKISFKLRILSEECMGELANLSIVPNMIYSFDMEIPEYYIDISYLRADTLDTHQLSNLFTK